MGKKIESKADAHSLALAAVKKASKDLRGSSFDSKASKAAALSHARGDNNHNKGRLS